jgi:serine/threonine protein phosphatase PrpC
MASPQAHAITQWLGMPLGEMKPHVATTLVPRGSWLLLCSDGLWNYCEAPPALARAFTDAAKNAVALAVCRALVAFANENGGADNITVGVVRV